MVKNSSKITLKSLAKGGVFRMYLAFFFSFPIDRGLYTLDL